MIFGGICAGGQGTRFSSEARSDIPKQFLLLDGKPVISYSVETFLQCEEIERVFIAVSEEYTEHCEKLFSPYGEKVKIIRGGASRGDTVALLAEECERNGADEGDILVTHDAARPFVTTEAIRRCVQAAKDCGVSGTALPASDTVLKCENGFVTAAPKRSEMYLAQTPQCFKIGGFNEVWGRLSEGEKELATDVCGMFFRAGVKVKLVEGDKECFKITFAEDLDRAEEMLLKKKAR